MYYIERNIIFTMKNCSAGNCETRRQNIEHSHNAIIAPKTLKNQLYRWCQKSSFKVLK